MSTLHVNFDPELMLLLREVHYLGGEPFLTRLPDPARILLRSTDDTLLRSTATRLETIVSRYNFVMINMKEFEKPLFERKLAKIDEVKTANCTRLFYLMYFLLLVRVVFCEVRTELFSI